VVQCPYQDASLRGGRERFGELRGARFAGEKRLKQALIRVQRCRLVLIAPTRPRALGTCPELLIERGT
jgi:hypothetical protein